MRVLLTAFPLLFLTASILFPVGSAFGQRHLEGGIIIERRIWADPPADLRGGIPPIPGDNRTELYYRVVRNGEEKYSEAVWITVDEMRRLVGEFYSPEGNEVE